MTRKFIFFLLAIVSAFAGRAQNTILKAGHYFDARTGKMFENLDIVVHDGKIAQVGVNIKPSPSDSVIDLSDSWVLPGLMDCHVHITCNFSYRNLNVEENYATESTAYRALRGSVVARELLGNGFTTIKEIGNDGNYATADIIRAIGNGWIQGPTIIYAGKIIAPYGGQSRGINPEHDHFWNYEYLDADNPAEIVKAVRENIYHGANVIKLETGDNGIYNVEDVKAAVDEAKKYGLKVTVHVANDAASANNVILGGAAAVEHGFALDNAQLQLMKDKGTFLVGTDFSFDNWYAYGVDSAYAKRMSDMVVDRLRRAWRIGTKMAFGTDVIINLPGLNRVQSNLRVLDSWKAAGIPSVYILQAMTIRAAELLGVDKERGVLEPNYFADIIAVKENPLQDIDAIRTVRFVMKEGKVIRKN